MKNKLDHLIHQLKGKSFPDSMRLEFYKFGENAFNELERGVSKNEYTATQTSNALAILQDLTREACQDKRKPLFKLAIKKCGHNEQKVRNTAVSVVIGLVRLFEHYPDSKLFDLGITSREEVFPVLKTAIDNGLDQHTEDYVNDFVSGRGVPSSKNES